jgi:timeless
MQNMETILENEKLTVERILTLIRFVLQIPADPAEEMRSDDDASVHDQVKCPNWK